MAKTAPWRDSAKFKPFYKSKAWADVRSVVLDRSHGLCERCMERGEVKPADVVHHTTPLNEVNVNDPDVSLNPDRLMALCHDCHTEVHQLLGVGAMNGRKEEKPRVGFDAEGNVIRL
ncbi:MAG: HNH endonuclease [Atopobiaceae bacterium]|nr:HNH endonuclease [Atopobiaceae bacterium]